MLKPQQIVAKKTHTLEHLVELKFSMHLGVHLYKNDTFLK